MVTLTENAADEIKRRLPGEGDAAVSVRIGLEAGGCAGTKYVITPGAARHPNDIVDNQFGLSILVDPISLTSLEGLTIDFVDALMGGGFRFDNPRAVKSCGCGASFGTAKAEPANIAE